jgi:hypothetical protein
LPALSPPLALAPGALICGACGWDLSDDEIERRILELVAAPADNRTLIAAT